MPDEPSMYDVIQRLVRVETTSLNIADSVGKMNEKLEMFMSNHYSKEQIDDMRENTQDRLKRNEDDIRGVRSDLEEYKKAQAAAETENRKSRSNNFPQWVIAGTAIFTSVVTMGGFLLGLHQILK